MNQRPQSSPVRPELVEGLNPTTVRPELVEGQFAARASTGSARTDLRAGSNSDRTGSTTVRPELVEGQLSLFASYVPLPGADHERMKDTLEIAIFALTQIAKGLTMIDKAEVPS